MKKGNVIKLVLLVALLCIGGTWWYFEVYRQDEPIVVEPDKDGIIQEELALMGETLQSGIREIGELNTAEYFFTRSETVEDYKTFDFSSLGIDWQGKIPLTTNTFTYSYDGEIKAGIDFSDIEVKIDKENLTLTIVLPKAKILSSAVDPDSYKFYEIKNNILNPISPEAYAVSFADLIHAEEDRAVEKGLLDRAQKNAETVVKNFVRSTMTSSDYKVLIETAA